MEIFLLKTHCKNVVRCQQHQLKTEFGEGLALSLLLIYKGPIEADFQVTSVT